MKHYVIMKQALRVPYRNLSLYRDVSARYLYTPKLLGRCSSQVLSEDCRDLQSPHPLSTYVIAAVLDLSVHCRG